MKKGVRSIPAPATLGRMNEPFVYRGRTITAQDVAFIQELIRQHPKASRRQLSKLLCEAWDWRQSNGALRDMLCRSMMLALHRAGHIQQR